MTDQTIPADKVRAWVTAWETTRPEHRTLDDAEGIIQALRDLLPPPPRPTLADMTPVARRECQWMQCEVRGDRRAIILIRDDRDHNHAVTLDPYGHTAHCPFERVTPRPDLPRLEWPGNKKPAPALPEGWKLADHQTRGRVIVTRPEPDNDGEVAIIRHHPGRITRTDTSWCDPDELTYLDQGDDQ